jgi:carboxyl-terminal processing protease
MANPKLKKYLSPVLIFLVGFIMGSYLFRSGFVVAPNQVNFTPLYETWGQVKNRFYNYSPQLQNKMLEGAMKGTIESLEDPYSDFLNAKEKSQFQQELAGQYEGIGAEITKRNGQITVVSPLKGSPAEQVGILANDKIVEINREKTSKMTLIQAVLNIRGKENTSVKLKIQRAKKILNLKVKRAKIEIPVLEFKMLKNNVGYVQIFNFYENTFPRFEEAVQELLNKGADKIILDLRNNPGGFLDSAVNIGGFFVPKNKLILKQDFGKGKVDNIKSPGPGTFSDSEIVILINAGSASASEILAGSISENNKKAVIVGEKSFGKGTVQEFINLSNNSAVKLTVAKWLLPSEKSIEKKGIEPDIEVKLTGKDIEKNKDPQLDRAKSLLK